MTMTAVDTLALSASQGYPVAAFHLGVLYPKRLVPRPINKDDLAARTWHVTASALDIASALDKTGDWAASQPADVAQMRKELPGRLEKLRQSLGPQLSAECDRRATEWTAAHVKR